MSLLLSRFRFSIKFKVTCLLLSTFFLLSCDNNYQNLIARYNFKFFGKSFFASKFTNPNLQQIYLSLGDYIGKQVIVSGKIKHLGKLSTYLILKDNTSAMLVFMDNLQLFDNIDTNKIIYKDNINCKIKK